MDEDRSKLRNINTLILHSEKSELAENRNSQSQNVDVVVRQADNDEQVVSLWLHGRSPHTQKAYSGDVVRFLKYVGKQINFVRLVDLQSFAD